MKPADKDNRPLSPHISIYRPQMTSISSIFIRLTGNALLVAGVLLVWWLVAAATGPQAFELANGVLTSPFGDLVMGLSLWALWYHGLGGLRHLIWDTGRGLDVKTSEKMGWFMCVGSVALTMATIWAL